MKRYVAIGMVILGMACATVMPSVGGRKIFVVEAQSLPVTKTVAWDANPPADAVINYNVSLDGVSIGTPTGTAQPIAFTTVGNHSVCVAATNTWGTGPQTCIAVNVIVPGPPKNVRVQ